MKIVFSIYDSLKNPYYAGGGARSTHEIAKRLAKQHDVSIVCGSYPHACNHVLDGVKYEHVGIQKAGPKFGQIIFSLLLPYNVVKKNYDVWFEHFLPPHSTGMLPLFTKKPVVGITTILHAHEFEKKYRLPFSFIEERGLRVYQHLIVLSEGLKKKVRALHPSAETTVIPVGVDRQFFSVIPRDEPYVLVVGRFDVFQKGIDLLLLIWKKVIAKNSTIHLVLAGGGSEKEKEMIQHLVTKYQLGSCVKILGRVDGKEKEQLMRSTRCIISTSRFESFGITALEAFAFEKPFICFDIDGYNWIPRDIGIKIPPFQIDTFVKQLSLLLKNKTKREKLGKKGRRLARQFDYDQIAHQYERYIKQIAHV